VVAHCCNDKWRADKLHFEGVKSFAVADGCQNVRMHRLAGDAGRNLPLFRR